MVEMQKYIPGDSIREIFIPQLEITYPLKGSLNNPKRVTKNCQEKFVLRKLIFGRDLRKHGFGIMWLQVNFWWLPCEIIKNAG